MLAFFHRVLNWFIRLFWNEEMEITLVGLQMSGKTTFVNVISVSWNDIRTSFSTFNIVHRLLSVKTK